MPEAKSKGDLFERDVFTCQSLAGGFEPAPFQPGLGSHAEMSAQQIVNAPGTELTAGDELGELKRLIERPIIQATQEFIKPPILCASAFLRRDAEPLKRADVDAEPVKKGSFVTAPVV